LPYLLRHPPPTTPSARSEPGGFRALGQLTWRPGTNAIDAYGDGPRAYRMYRLAAHPETTAQGRLNRLTSCAEWARPISFRHPRLCTRERSASTTTDPEPGCLTQGTTATTAIAHRPPADFFGRAIARPRLSQAGANVICVRAPPTRRPAREGALPSLGERCHPRGRGRGGPRRQPPLNLRYHPAHAGAHGRGLAPLPRPIQQGHLAYVQAPQREGRRTAGNSCTRERLAAPPLAPEPAVIGLLQRRRPSRFPLAASIPARRPPADSSPPSRGGVRRTRSAFRFHRRASPSDGRRPTWRGRVAAYAESGCWTSPPPSNAFPARSCPGRSASRPSTSHRPRLRS